MSRSQARYSALNVYLDGSFVGEVRQSPHGALRFAYDPSYAGSGNPTPLSLSLPLKESSHRPRSVRAFLEGLLPDSEGARARWGREYGVSPRNPFALLAHVGRDAAGAVQILPPDVPSADAQSRDGDVQWLTDDDLGALADELAANQSDWDPGRFGGRWSLAGAQPKVALFQEPESERFGIPRDSTPTNVIVKPAIAGYEHHHINEALCMNAAREAGLLAARSEIAAMGNHQVLISHRYDRQRRGGVWRRIHQEDMCQALSVHPSLKYQSDGGPGVGEIADLLNRLPVVDRDVNSARFFKGLCYNVLIGGTDAHAKNYSLILIGHRAQVAPLYDVASNAPYEHHERLVASMKIGNHWRMLDVTNEDWARVGRRLGVSGDQAVAWAEELREEIPEALDRAVESMPDEVRDEARRMSERIGEHAQGTWKPSLSRNPAHVISHASLDASAKTGSGRVPRGVPEGGQFASVPRAEADVTLDP